MPLSTVLLSVWLLPLLSPLLFLLLITTIAMTVAFMIINTLASAGDSIAIPFPIPRTSSPIRRSLAVSQSDAAQAQFANAAGTPTKES